MLDNWCFGYIVHAWDPIKTVLLILLNLRLSFYWIPRIHEGYEAYALPTNEQLHLLLYISSIATQKISWLQHDKKPNIVQRDQTFELLYRRRAHYFCFHMWSPVGHRVQTRSYLGLKAYLYNLIRRVGPQTIDVQMDDFCCPRSRSLSSSETEVRNGIKSWKAHLLLSAER